MEKFDKPTKISSNFKWLIPLLGGGLIILHWFLDTVKPNNFIYDVNELKRFSFLESRFTYFYMHLFAIIPILSYSFESKVHYYKKWKYLFPALLIVATVFWIWDVAKTSAGVWNFNERYYTFRILNLPIEEWFFFITFPWASVFIYECLNYAFPTTAISFIKKIDTPLSWSLIIAFIGVGFLFWGHLYTVTAFWYSGFLLLWQYLYGDKNTRLYFYRAFPIMTIPFILVNGVFTGMFTEQPIVVYNPEEYLGIRFVTIPLDDFCYNFGLQLGVLMLYERFKIHKRS